MNAIELANELKQCLDDNSTDLVCVKKAADMLLQQAKEIEQLKLRELTDEEIWKIHDATNTNNWVIDFAKTILKKANEK